MKSIMALPNPGLTRPPRSPTSNKPVAGAAALVHKHIEGQPSTADTPHGVQQLAKQARNGSTAEMQHQSPGSFGRQDGASNGSSESSELENREAQQQPQHKKSMLALRQTQSK